jgi:hypothetical protein
MEKLYKRRRSIIAVVVTILVVLFGLNPEVITDNQPFVDERSNGGDVLSEAIDGQPKAVEILQKLEVKGRTPKTGYSRDEFGSGWASIEGCDTRNLILQQSLINPKIATDNCIVLSGTLQDPYTAQTIDFLRGSTTSDKVQIDHVVALSDAWQKGAQGLDFSDRVVFANDPLNLLAVDGSANRAKGDSDAASWLPSNRSFWCRYVARQIAVKYQYGLWVTPAEKAAMQRILSSCRDQVVPRES